MKKQFENGLYLPQGFFKNYLYKKVLIFVPYPIRKKMKTVNYSELRSQLKSNLDMVCEDHETLIVHRPGGKSVVLMSLEEYNSQKETEYLLSSEKNAEHLAESIKQLKNRDTISVTLEKLKSFEK